ncbi:hypothetical protein [Rhizobium sp. BK491]|uniref:hypothetical protein n=1 Tax=Rhizobium sp. BK491 TaxID=2587009 RepID=UPI00161E2DFE|nr:hypothetical protein [Rhizobium sp. BK491]MBB3567255.1 hypothetical protein [Rhizobium sp. BK491]
MMNLDQARTYLPEARDLAGLASEQFVESYDTKTSRAEICVVNRMTGEIEPIAYFTPDCSYDDRRLLLKAPELVRALLVIMETAFDKIRSLEPRPPRQHGGNDKPKDYAAECAMKCNDRQFRRFLMDRHNVPDVADAERIAVSVRNILRIKSRGELNTDPAAAQRWIEFRGSFEAWKRHG